MGQYYSVTIIYTWHLSAALQGLEAVRCPESRNSNRAQTGELNEVRKLLSFSGYKTTAE